MLVLVLASRECPEQLQPKAGIIPSACRSNDSPTVIQPGGDLRSRTEARGFWGRPWVPLPGSSPAHGGTGICTPMSQPQEGECGLGRICSELAPSTHQLPLLRESVLLFRGVSDLP